MAEESNNKMVIVLVLVVGIVAVVAVVIAAIAIAKPGPSTVQILSGGQAGGGSSGGQGGAPPPRGQGNTGGAGGANVGAGGDMVYNSEKIWLIADGHDYGAHSYINQTGWLDGFNRDMMLEVCKAAGVQCRLVWDKYINCWNSAAGEHAMGGMGLMGGWYDACMGWYQTIDRIHVFEYSMAWQTPPKAYFWVKIGGAGSWTKDLKNKKIGFVDGWASDEKCLARQTGLTNNFLEKTLISYYTEPSDLANDVRDGKIDAAFTTITTMTKFSDIVEPVQDNPMDCLIAGISMMVPKGSALPGLWNEGFGKLRASGKFGKMCTEAAEKHGLKGTIDCVAS